MSDERARSSGGPGSTVRIEEPTDFRAQVAAALKARSAPKLVVIAGPDAGVHFRLQRSMVIGRDPSAGVALSDTSVSFAHARVEDRGDAWAVVDLGSTNGTKVDDLRAAESLLRPGTKIQVGTTVIRFEVQDAADEAYDQMVERLITLDDLTGLYQRRRFDRDVAQLVAAGRPLALYVMDLDGIKRINDTHGHLFGAHVIANAGDRLRRALATLPGAFGARFGGDEYTAAVLDIADGEHALQIGESFRALIADAPYPKDGVELHVGVSIGVALAPSDAASADELFTRADAALYPSKQAGKHRVPRA